MDVEQLSQWAILMDSGRKSTDDLRTILKHFLDLRQSWQLTTSQNIYDSL